MWKYEDVLTHARRHSDATLSVANLAARCGMRQDVFSRSFSRDLGVSPKKYLADLLTRRVSLYLLTTRLSIKEIAAELSFSSQYYLSRFFKKQTKLSPSEYRRQSLERSAGGTGRPGSRPPEDGPEDVGGRCR
jgi:transcriptional regulator GlxA family with amidase domain